MSQIIFLIVFLLYSLSAPVSCNLTRSANCTTHEACSDGRTCCGECGQSFCCDSLHSRHLELNVSDCKNNIMEEIPWDSSAKMLGVIIGGMVGSFTVAMLVHTLARKLVKKWRERRRTSETNQAADNAAYLESEANQIDPSTPPSYENIHLYQKTHAEGDDVVREPTCKEENDDYKLESEVHVDDELPPAYYGASVHIIDEKNTSEPTNPNDVNSIHRPGTSTSAGTDRSVNTDLTSDEVCAGAVMTLANSLGITGTRQEMVGKMMDVLRTLDSEDATGPQVIANCEHTHAVTAVSEESAD